MKIHCPSRRKIVGLIETPCPAPSLPTMIWKPVRSAVATWQNVESASTRSTSAPEADNDRELSSHDATRTSSELRDPEELWFNSTQARNASKSDCSVRQILWITSPPRSENSTA